jgi:hypothetical protein
LIGFYPVANAKCYALGRFPRLLGARLAQRAAALRKDNFMGTPKGYQKELNLKQLFEDEIGSPLVFLVGALRSNNEGLKKNAKKALKENIINFKNDKKFLGSDYFSQLISQIESTIIHSSSDADLMDKLQNIWNDFREKTKKAGVV